MLSFLPTYMAAYVFVLVALLGARIYVKRFEFGGPDAMVWSMIWIIISTAAFLGQYFLVFALIVGVACSKLVPSETATRAIYFVAILPVIPMFNYRVPGPPGINYLFNLNYSRLLILCLLVPIAWRWMSDRKPRQHGTSARSRADTLVILYTIWTCVVVLMRADSVTEGIRRALIDNALFTALPYFVVSRALTDLESIRRVAIAVVFSGVMVSFIGILEQYAHWWFYQYLPGVLRGLDAVEFLVSYERWGLIRVKSSIDGGIGYFTVVVLGCLMFLSTVGSVRRWFALTCAALVATTLFFTGARGSMLAAAVMIAIYVKFNWVNSPFKLVLALVGCIASLEIVDAVLASFQDSEGTFDYRRQLLVSAAPLIMEKFFFGLSAEEMYWRLAHLRQGEGIVDIVNTYLLVGLTSGGLALVFFVGIFLTLMFETIVVRPTGTAEEKKLSEAIKRVLISLLLMTMVLIATVSPTGFLSIYNWLIFSLAAAYGRMAKQSARAVIVQRREQSRRTNRSGQAVHVDSAPKPAPSVPQV